jgi:hypothetical protein
MNSSYPEDLLTFMTENDQWVRDQVQQNAVDDDSEDGQYWSQVELVIAQLDGIYDGYDLYAPQEEVIIRCIRF